MKIVNDVSSEYHERSHQWHYEAATELLEQAESNDMTEAVAQNIISMAQVHATLAQYRLAADARTGYVWSMPQ